MNLSKFFGTLKLVFNSAAGRGLLSSLMLFSSFLAIISTFPVLECYIKEGRRKALSALLFGSAVSLIMGGNLGMALYVGFVGVMTVFVGELINRGCSVPRTILYSGLLALGCIALAGAYVSHFYSIDPVVFLSDKIDTVFTTALKTYPDALKTTLIDTGMTQKELAMFVAIKLPAVAIVGWMLFLFINVLFASRFDFRANSFFRNENLSTFKISDFLVIPTLLSGILYIYSISKYNNTTLIEATATMLFATFVSVYFLQGLLIAFLLVRKVFTSGFWSTLIVITLAVMGYVVMAGVGFFDTWFDFRKYFLNKDIKGEKL